MQGELVEDEQYVIDEEELIMQSHAIDNDEEPYAADITRLHFAAAHEVLRITNAVDEKLQLQVLDQHSLVVSRDVLAAYKTLLYRAYVDFEHVNNKKNVWQVLTIAGFGLAAILTIFGIIHYMR